MPLTLSKIFDVDQLRSSVRESHVVFLVDDLYPYRTTCVFGQERLRFIAHFGEGGIQKVLRIPINFSSSFGDLEFALAVVESEKGFHEYQLDE